VFIRHFIFQYEVALELGVTGNRQCKTDRGWLMCNGNDTGNLVPKKSLSHKFAVMGETYCPQQNTPPLDRGVGCGDTLR